jgi:uncharacterized protein YcaQ
MNDSALWSGCGTITERIQAVEELVEAGMLTPLRIGEKAWPYYMLTDTVKLLDQALPVPRMIFLGPLDSLLWDRKAIIQLFDFDYIWEVYKPPAQRKWGYYVLPVFYGDRFVARLDSRLEKGVWTISRWWWEHDITPDATMLDALHTAVEAFLYYLGADNVRVDEGVDMAVRQAILDP